MLCQSFFFIRTKTPLPLFELMLSIPCEIRATGIDLDGVVGNKNRVLRFCSISLTFWHFVGVGEVVAAFRKQLSLNCHVLVT